MSTISTLSAASPAAPTGASSQHDARGRFVKGNPGGPGNPLAGKVNKVRNAFLDYFEGPGMQALCDFLFRKALSGDPRFMRIILQYTVGRLPIDDGVAEAFTTAMAEAAAGAALDDEIEEGGDGAPVDGGRQDADCPSPISSPHSDVGRDEHRTDPKSAAHATEPVAQPHGMGQVSAPSRLDIEVAPPLGAAIADVPKRPHSKNRKGLLKMMDQREPLCGESSAGPPSTNGLGDARHISLVGT